MTAVYYPKFTINRAMLLLTMSLLFMSSLPQCHPTESTTPTPTNTEQTTTIPPQDFLARPSSVEAKEGDSVTLACVVQNRKGEVQWTKDGFGLGNLIGFDRYNMAGNESQGGRKRYHICNW